MDNSIDDEIHCVDTESESDFSESESDFRFYGEEDSHIEIESRLANEFDYRLGFHAVRLLSNSTISTFYQRAE